MNLLIRPEAASTPSLLVTAKEGAEICGVSVHKFRRAIGPVIGEVRIGRCVRFMRTDVALWRAKRAAAARELCGTALASGPKDFIAAAADCQRETDRKSLEHPGVYAIRAGKFIKIGKAARSIRERLRNLQIGQPYEIELIGVLSDDPADEPAAHAAMRGFHVRGEWYELSEKSLAVVERMIVHGVRP